MIFCYLGFWFFIVSIHDNFHVVGKASLQNVMNTTRLLLDPPIEETLHIRKWFVLDYMFLIIFRCF